MLFRSNETAYEMQHCDWSSDVCSSDLDEVAYVRFASVYREFRDIQTFRDEINKLFTEFDKGKLAATPPEAK